MMTETEHLIRQAARELGLENITVEASLENPGLYNVTVTTEKTELVMIPMSADFVGIVAQLKTVKGHDGQA